MRKRLLSALLALCMVAALLPTQVFADDIVTRGQFGNNLWVLDISGTLVISGTEAMHDYRLHNDSTRPWHEYLSNIKEIVITEGVTSIGAYAFENCNNLISVTIADSVASIGMCAFYGCSNLSNIIFPDSIISIGSQAFDSCSSLRNITLPNKIDTIGFGTFAGCGMSSITIPSSVTTISGHAFYGCSNLVSVVIPSSVTTIGSNAFADCSSLVNITIPNGVSSIAESTFEGCSSLTDISIPDGITSIGAHAFEECSSLMDITIPNDVALIEEYAFASCRNIKSIIFPDSVATIGFHAFDTCSSLESAYFQGDAPSLNYWSLTSDWFGSPNSTSVFDNCADNFTIYYRMGTSGWTDSSAYDVATQTWNGYPLRAWGEEENPPYTHFGKLDRYDRSGSAMIDGVEYQFTEEFKNSTSNAGFLEFGDYLDNYIYALYALNEDNKITALKYDFGAICKLEGWDAANSIVHTDGFIVGPNGPQLGLESGDCRVSDIVKDSFPADQIGNWIEDDIRIYTNGQEIFKAIHVEYGTGVVTAFDPDVAPLTVYIDEVPYPVVENDSSLVDTIRVPFDGQSQYIKDADFTLYDGVLVELKYTNENLDPTNFNEYVYRADMALSDEAYSGWRKNLSGDINGSGTPSRVTVDAGKESGFAALAYTWTGTTKLFESLIDSPSGAVEYLTITQKDMYTAIILDSLEFSYAASAISRLDKISKNSRTISKLLFDEIKLMKESEIGSTTNSWEDVFGELGETEKNYIIDSVTAKFEKEYGFTGLKYNADFFNYLSTGLDVAKNFDSWLETVTAYAYVRSLNSEMQTVIQMMYDYCPNDNLYMRSALQDIARIISAGEEEYSALTWLQGGVTAGKFALIKSVDFFWDKIIMDHVKEFFPEVAIIKLAYKAGKLLTNALTNIDSQTEAYYDMLALLNYEQLGRSVMNRFGTSFAFDKTQDNAKLYLEAVRLNLQILNLDCDYAVKFSEASRKNILTGLISGKDIDEYISNCKYVKNSIFGSAKTKFDTGWIQLLLRDYPDLYDEYAERLTTNYELKREIEIHCPVDVFVYDANGDLVAYVEDGSPYATGNISIFVSGDDKDFYFYDNEEYFVKCEGYGEGTMDVFIREFDNDQTTRQVNFLNVPVDDGSEHELSVVSGYQLENDGNIISPTFDSQADNRQYTVKINGGFATKNDTFECEFTASCGEVIEVFAYLPVGYSFDGWSADSDEVLFEDSTSLSTSFIMPESDVVINAFITESNPSQPSIPDTPTDPKLAYTVAIVASPVNGGTVTGSGTYNEGESVTVSATPASGYRFASWTENGQQVSTSAAYMFSITKDRTLTAVFERIGSGTSSGSSGGGTPRPSVKQPSSTTTTTPTTPSTLSSVFSDVPSNHIFATEIAWARDNGIMSGYSDGTFRPNANTNRQQMWMVLARIAGTNPSNMAEARTWAVNSGISDGTNPENTMSRQQLVTMLYRFAQSQGVTISGSADLSNYPDAGMVASYATEALAWAVGNGIVTGTSDGRLNPEGTATRAHFAAFLYRYSNLAPIAGQDL